MNSPAANASAPAPGRWALLALFLALPLLVLAINWHVGSAPRAPRAAHGELDLRGIDFTRTRASLDGEWTFYWQRLIAPESFAHGDPPPPDGFVAVPRSWPGLTVAGTILEQTGFATLRLSLRVDPSLKPGLSLRVNDINAAYRLWANGQLVAQAGRVAPRADDEVHEQKAQLVSLPSNDGRIDLVLQTSNFHPQPRHMSPIQIGFDDQLRNRVERRNGVTLLIAGTLLLIGIYHIALYLYRPDNRPPLYFALYSLLWMATLLSNQTDWPLRIFFPELSSELLFRSFRLGLLLSSAFGFHFFHSLYPREFPRWTLAAFWAVTLVMAALAVAAPVPLTSAALPFYYPAVTAKMAISLWALTRAVARQRRGASIILAGYVLYLLFGLNDMLNDLRLIETPLVMQFGMLIFILAQALALARRFSKLFGSVEALSHELAAQNQTLKNEIAERVSAQQDIVALTESVRSRISHELHDGLCQQLTGARLLCATLTHGGKGASPSGLARLATILDAAVTHAHDLSKGLWPMEPASNDLRRSLAELARQQSAATGIPIEYSESIECIDHDGDCACECAPHAFSIAREALANAAKHAQPRRITVTLDCRAQQLTLSVSDDGIGWNHGEKKARTGLGLRIMAYRARMVGGDFRMEQPAAGGTRAVCTLPCPAAGAD